MRARSRDPMARAGSSAFAQYGRERVRRRHLWAWSAALLSCSALAAVWALASGLYLVLLALATLALAGAVLRYPRSDPGRWKRGGEGEQMTAALLDRLSSRRWAVLHDRRVPGSAANIDHMVIGRRGVWVIDSKALRGAVSAGRRSVSAGARRLDTSPTAWEAEVVSDRLGVPARPLVVIHGSGLPRRGRAVGGVRVIPADAMLRRIRHGRASPKMSRDRMDELVTVATRVFR